ncbi:restriction endonuclease subunit S [Ruminococcus bicirculans (ex Wegman et al. 2014)]|uniref:restriction endonuclease subunit S n=1 Tax=Ruminococcus bicirculans (ex Wegman et al. 2014) TaxID=1160721 RepID=UPI003670D19A
MTFETVRLGDVVLFNPRESIKKGVIAKKIDMSVLQPFTRDVPSYELLEYKGGTKFRNGDTIMARITPCLENGKTAKVNVLEKNEVGFGSTEYIVFRAINGISDEDFVYYLVCSPIVREPAIKSMVGSSGRQRVQTDVLQNLEINLPDLETQRIIGSILRGIDDRISLNTAINENLEQQAQAIYAQMFIESAEESWKTGSLSDIAVITMGQSPKGDTFNETGEGAVFYQGRTDFGFRFPTRRLYTTEPKRIALCGDALMSVRAPVGDLNVAYEECCIGRGLAAIHSKDNHQSFVLYTLFTLKKQLDVFNGEGTVFGSINKESLNSMEITIPPRALMDKFESIVSSIDRAIRNNYEEICRLQAIRDTLLPKLMNGEIDVSAVKI